MANQDAPVFVCVHGLGMSGRYFKYLKKELSPEFIIISPDLPGFGKSKRPEKTYTLVQHATFIVDRLKREGWENVVLVGHSMGCQIVLEAACREPHLVRKMILIAPTVNPNEASGGVQMLRLVQNSFLEPPTLPFFLLPDYLRCGIPRYIKTLRFMLDQDIRDRLARCSAETIVVAGSKDPIVALAWAREASSLLPQGKIKEITAAHAVHYSHSKEVAQLCRELGSGS